MRAQGDKSFGQVATSDSASQWRGNAGGLGKIGCDAIPERDHTPARRLSVSVEDKEQNGLQSGPELFPDFEFGVVPCFFRAGHLSTRSDVKGILKNLPAYFFDGLFPV
jgi:hypothetical protein